MNSVNVDNLFFAGRNISATHMAMSSARVMGTCGTIGQAVGVAAFVAKKYNCLPREAGKYIDEIQQTLLNIDCYLPQVKRKVSDICLFANLSGVSDVVRNGEDRVIDGSNNGTSVENGNEIKYSFYSPTFVESVKIVFDSDITRMTFDMNEVEKNHSMRCNILDASPIMHIPKTLAKRFNLKATIENGEKVIILTEENNIRRSIFINVNKVLKDVSLTIFNNWGKTPETNIFTFELY